MRKLLLFSLVFVLSLTLGYGMAIAGNGAPAGPHYNLNIIGVKKAKNPDMTGTKGHTIFVALGSKDGDAVRTKIFLTPGDFEVCDRNGFDPAYDCEGNQIGHGKNGAVFQLPCNLYLPTGDPEADEYVLVPCDVDDTAEYVVFARALGSPGGSAVMSTCYLDCYMVDDVEVCEEICSDETIELSRGHGKQVFQDVTKELTSFYYCEEICEDSVCETVCTRTALFAGEFEDWFWAYDNNGLKLAQLRFYLLDDVKNWKGTGPPY